MPVLNKDIRVIKLGILSLLWVSAFILYNISEYGVSYTIIYLDFILFVIGTVIISYTEFKNRFFFCFNIIFLLSFFLTTYFFVLFIYETPLDLRLWAAKYIDYNYLTKAISLSTLSICSYFIGYALNMRYFSQGDGIKSLTDTISKKGNKMKDKSMAMFRIISFLLIINIAYLYITGQIDGITLNVNPFLTQLFLIFLIFSLILNNLPYTGSMSLTLFLKVNRKLILLTISLLILFLYVGDRGFPINIILIFLSYYTLFVNKIRLRYTIIFLIMGAFILFAIQIGRNSRGALKNGELVQLVGDTKEKIGENSALLVFSDLYGANNELCLGYEYNIKKGLITPEYIFIVPFTPLPFLPTLLSNLIYNKKYVELSSGMILNDYMSSAIEASFGSHIVIDSFMRWGEWGCIILFTLLGLVVSYFSSKKYCGLFEMSVFLLLTAGSLYISRSSIVDIVRPIGLIWIILFLLNNYKKRAV